MAEGHGRYTPRAHRSHLYIARGSLAETDSWLDQLRRMGYLTTEEEAPLLQDCREITAMLTHKILALDRLIEDGGAQLRETQESYDVEVATLPQVPFDDEDYV
ncbi:MAG: four helix bundle protein [Roseiflexaceae bacterium]|nr:four helix bundle protein [Roseiflexaceae bacterium]